MAVEDNIEVTQEEIDAVEPVDVEITDETVEDLFLQMVRHFYSKHHRDNNK